MVNSKNFSERLKKVMEFHHLTASLFADKISVQRSSISHILSGRNKPSLDFVLKVTAAFKDVDLYWLLNGNGVFPRSQEKIQSASTPTIIEKSSIETDSSNQKRIQRIVVFYSDGTFEEYKK